jgi:hypothetical protein
MVVVQVTEKDVSDVDCALSGLQQPMVSAGTVIHDDDVVPDFDEVA